LIGSKYAQKGIILTDKNGISLSIVITSASTHDIKAVTEVIDNTDSKRSSISLSHTTKDRRKQYKHIMP
jgi:hypothetical protein